MKIIDIEIMSRSITALSFTSAVDKVRELVEYTTRPPARVQLFPSDHNRICAAIRRKFAKDARDAAKAAGVKGKSRDQQFPPETFDGLSFRGIPVECGIRASKPIRV
jgi:hypothetical protein